MQRVLVDTGVWLALCDPRDSYFNQLDGFEGQLRHAHLIVPWPTLYETLRTRFVGNAPAMARFQNLLTTHRRIEYLADETLRDEALSNALNSQPKRPLSLVDSLIRLHLSDPSLRVDLLATLNVSDFADVCVQRGIRIIP